jgi:hypothetical protein
LKPSIDAHWLPVSLMMRISSASGGFLRTLLSLLLVVPGHWCSPEGSAVAGGAWVAAGVGVFQGQRSDRSRRRRTMISARTAQMSDVIRLVMLKYPSPFFNVL